MARDLEGPGVTPDEARAAVGSVCASFEIVGGAVPLSDRPEKFRGFLASGMGHYAVVRGPAVDLPAGLSDRDVEVELRIDGASASQKSHQGAAHFEVLAGLANQLTRLGRRLEAGHRVITGAQIIHVPERAGVYEATVAGVGDVSFELTD